MPESSKTITVKIPPSIPEDDAKRVIEAVLAKRSRRKEGIWRLRERLGIKPEDLMVDIDASGYEKVEKKEKEELEELKRLLNDQKWVKPLGNS